MPVCSRSTLHSYVPFELIPEMVWKSHFRDTAPVLIKWYQNLLCIYYCWIWCDEKCSSPLALGHDIYPKFWLQFLEWKCWPGCEIIIDIVIPMFCLCYLTNFGGTYGSRRREGRHSTFRGGVLDSIVCKLGFCIREYANGEILPDRWVRCL